jgi:glutathione S-transferase
MKLYFSPSSPFARKVRLAAAVLGIKNKLELVPTDVFQPSPSYKRINPLVKVPALEMENGEMLVNSPFICQYLAQKTPGGHKLFPVGPELWKSLNFQAVADGGLDAAVLRRWEAHVRTPGKFDAKIDLRQKVKVENALEFFESQVTALSKETLTIREISVLCFVDYLNFRFSHENWNHRFPRVFAWAQKWNEKADVKETFPR